jgi:hypothetical protein
MTTNTVNAEARATSLARASAVIRVPPDGRQSNTGNCSTAASNRQIRLPLYGPDGATVVAVITRGALTKQVDGSRHFLRVPPAIALDADAVATAEAQDIQAVIVTDRETGNVYSTTIAELRAHGWQLERSAYGKQIAMRLSRWSVNGNPPKDAPAAQPAPKSEPAQLALW